jgi:hypothetical protein
MKLKYVARKDTKEARRLIRECFEKLRLKLREKEITFSVAMVGSAKRNLVLAPVELDNTSNKLFDIDYNVFLYKRGGLSILELFKIFTSELSKIMNKQNFTLEISSHKALKFYFKDRKVRKWSYELAIFVKNNESLNLINIETNHLESEKKYTSPLEHLRDIKKSQLGNKLRDEYQKIRESHFEDGRKSYESFLEAVNNVWTSNCRPE